MKIKAYYYYITNEITDVVEDEGIISEPEDTIYPGQNTGNDDLPFECEACKFNVEEYNLKLIEFEISRNEILERKTKTFIR